MIKFDRIFANQVLLTHPLPDDWQDKLETVHITNSVGDGVEAEKKVYDAYLKLKEALEKEGIQVLHLTCICLLTVRILWKTNI